VLAGLEFDFKKFTSDLGDQKKPLLFIFGFVVDSRQHPEIERGRWDGDMS